MPWLAIRANTVVPSGLQEARFLDEESPMRLVRSKEAGPDTPQELEQALAKVESWLKALPVIRIDSAFWLDQTDTKMALLMLAKASTRAARAILVLCQQGINDQALAPLRTMFEATAKLLYISLLPEQRGAAFMGSAAAREDKWVGRARAETRKGHGTPFQALLGRQERLDEIAASFAEATEDAKKWNDVSMETMADAAGLPYAVYVGLCDNLHSDPAALGYLIRQEGEEFVPGADPSQDGTGALAIPLAIALLTRIIPVLEALLNPQGAQ